MITGLALPVSVISTFTVMRALNFTLNVLTLMGPSLALGLLIDDAIAVRENIVRHMHPGPDHFTPVREPTAETRPAVVATTVIALVVKAVVGLRPTAENEEVGLDLTDHGEAGYEF